ncbi:hypothetical protein [Nicoliella lavandulae]|uniref:Tetratricopeptide repeat protein n=1 Tax=Nicoliella lavandulae TaxID=3082954 RepID=A0ABU8SK36_9LACO
MKKILGAIITIIIIGIFGGWLINNHRTTVTDVNSAIDRGNQDIQNQQYHSAVVDFKQALDAQPNNQVAVNTLQQLQAFQAANSFYQVQHLVTASQQYQKVIDLKQSKTLVSRATQQKQTTDTLLSNAITLTNIYNQALRFNHLKKYKQSSQVLAAALQNQNLNNPYFKKIATRVKTLHTANSAKRIDKATVTNRLAIRPDVTNNN